MQKTNDKNELLVSCFDRLFANNTLQKPLIFAFDEVDSTNTEAKLYAQGCGEGESRVALFFTRTQRAGRGTRMRTFESPRDGGLYMSLLVFPNERVDIATRITMLSAVAVCKVIGKLLGDSERAKIKWVNDITIEDKKLSGILTEAKLDECGVARYVIIGIGVNLTPKAHSDEVRAIMTCLDEHGVNITPEELCALITEELLLSFTRDDYNFLNEYRRLCSVIGKDISVFTANGSYPARALGIADDGALTIEKENGEIENLISADVSIRPI